MGWMGGDKSVSPSCCSQSISVARLLGICGVSGKRDTGKDKKSYLLQAVAR